MSGSPGDLFDADARDRIANDLDSTLFVEAGAGTGKTTALVARIVSLVRTGACELREVAAITFTEAAAFELRERVRAAIAAAVAAEPDDARLRRALGQVDEAAMSTIHGFCQKILAEYPLEAQLPLRFQVLDDVAASISFDRRFAAFLDELFDEPASRALLGAANCLQIAPTQLRLLARLLDERWEAGTSPTAVDPALPSILEHEVQAAVLACGHSLRALYALKEHCLEEDDYLRGRLVELGSELARYDTLQDWIDGLRWLYELQVRKPGNLGRAEAWPSVDISEIRAALAAFEAQRLACLAGLSDLVLSNLLRRLAAESEQAAASRRAAGTLRFQDLLVLTYELLVAKPNISRAVRTRYRKILVDEFQDTDPLQLKIVLLLGGQDDGRPEGGRLFFVGDPKQSIYRFRGADVSLYSAARDALLEGLPTYLVSNFRSVPGIVDWVNGVFSELLNDRGEGGSNYVPLGAVRADQGAQLPVIVLGGPSDEKTSALARRDNEAEEIARTIELARDEQWAVHDEGTTRPARLRDVAIVVPRRTGLFALERALERHEISYRVASSTLIYGSSEVRDLRAVLLAISSSADERAIVSALRTPAFACSDEEILRYRLAGGQLRLDADAVPQLEESPPSAALAALGRLQAEQYRLGVVGVVQYLVEERRLVALQAPAWRRHEALRRIDFVLDRARAFAASGGEGIDEFIALLDLEAQLGVRGVELPTDDETEDALTILTVHGAKGLEFPIVVLAELGGPTGSPRRGPSLLSGADGGLEARVRFGIETSGYPSAFAIEEEAEEKEALRLAYVGATRARDHLVLSLSHYPAKSDRARSLAERLYLAWQQSTAVARTTEVVDAQLKLQLRPPLGRDLSRGVLDGTDLAAWQRERERLLERLRLPRSVAATALSPHQWSPVAARHRVEESGEGVAWREPRAATRIGRAVHAVLQLVDLAQPASLGTLCRTAAVEEDCPTEAPMIERLVGGALRSKVIERAMASARCYRELPISVAVEGGVLEAVIDLCFEENDQLVVVDYKTDALAEIDEVPAAAGRYLAQAGAYALALQAVAARPVSSVVLLFLGLPGGAVEHEISDLAAAMAEARQRSSALFTSIA